MVDAPKTQREEFRFWMRALFVPITVGGVLLVILALSFAVTEGHPVATANLQRVQVGMTKADVQQILGHPNITEDQLWTYMTSWTWCVVRIRFDVEGRVEEIDHDH
jgi:outer membrane protein assembly factor BamE (lipoprotein component of BamABCDE complex)